MPKYKEKVMLPLSIEIEEEYLVFENEFDRIQLKCYVAKGSIYELSKTIECLENYQTNYVFYDPIADYIEELYIPTFQLFFHYEKQIHLLLPLSFQNIVFFGSSTVKGFKYQISSLTGFIGGFMLFESNN